MPMLVVNCPPGHKAGSTVQVQHNGVTYNVTVPDGVKEGGSFQFAVPDADMAKHEVVPVAQSMDRLLANPAASGLAMPVGGGGTGNFLGALAQVQALYIKQEFHAVEMCGWERKNEYRVYPCDPNNWRAKGEQLFHITEDSDCLERQCCSVFRSARFDFRLGTHAGSPVVASVFKEFHLNLCFFWMRPKAVIRDVAGTDLGSVYDPCAVCAANNIVSLPDGTAKYKVGGTLCQLGACCPCDTFHFEIEDLVTGSRGSLRKHFNGCEELLTAINQFVIIFPPDALPEDKAALLSSMVLLDLAYFEVNKNNN